jgi:hypothetical protein
MANVAVGIEKPCARIQTYPYHLEDGDVRACDSVLRHAHAGAIMHLMSTQQCFVFPLSNSVSDLSTGAYGTDRGG